MKTATAQGVAFMLFRQFGPFKLNYLTHDFLRTQTKNRPIRIDLSQSKNFVFMRISNNQSASLFGNCIPRRKPSL